MRLVKLFFISLVVLFGVITFLFMLFPADIRISRVIMIADSKEKIMSTLQDFRTWDSWNLFVRNGGLTHRSFSFPSSGKGAFMSSDQIRIVHTSVARDSLRTSWQQIGGKSFQSTFTMLQQPGNQVAVQWYLDFHFNWFPWEKLGSMFYDKKLGPLMEGSLLNLKGLVENIH